MNLADFLGKNVRIKDIDGKYWTGFVEGFTDSYNNPEEKDCIDVRIKPHIYLFFYDEIESIEAI